MPDQPSTRDAIRAWLLDYAWSESHTAEQKAANVDCILAQGDWQWIATRAEQLAGQAFEPGPEAFNEAYGFALSALYECHDGPHTDTCPDRRP